MIEAAFSPLLKSAYDDFSGKTNAPPRAKREDAVDQALDLAGGAGQAVEGVVGQAASMATLLAPIAL